MKRNVLTTLRPDTPTPTLTLAIHEGQGPLGLVKLPKLPKLPDVRLQRPPKHRRLQRPQRHQRLQRLQRLQSLQRHLECKIQTTGMAYCREYASLKYLTTYVKYLPIIDFP